MNDDSTYGATWLSRGRSVGLVAFLFGATGRTTLPGVVLRRLLEDLGLSPDASRALLSRMRRNGQLAGDRHGRNVHYRLAGEFARGFERVRDQAMANHQPTGWSGSFHGLLYRVPERQRGFRDVLRRSAVFAGYGILQQGVLISPTDRSGQLEEVVATRPPGAHVWMTTLGMEPREAARAASIAWDLPGLAQVYRSHTDHLTRRADANNATLRRPGSPEAGTASDPGALRDYVDTLLPVLTDTLREPGLPAALMPADWPGPALRVAIAGFTDSFSPTTDAYLQTLLD